MDVLILIIGGALGFGAFWAIFFASSRQLNKLAALSIRALPFIWLVCSLLWLYIWIAYYYSANPQNEAGKLSHIILVVFGMPALGFFVTYRIRKSLINYLLSIEG